MMNDRPLILITNDDGIQAKGIKELVFCLRAVGDIVVFAPDGPRSGMSSAITSVAPIHYTLVKKEEGLTQYCCSGTPVNCVKLAVNEVLDRKPDLLVSGINHGSNSSINVIYSGTMSAAVEAGIEGIPAIGFSLADYNWNANFEATKPFIKKIALEVLNNKMPNGTVLNVNFPKLNLNEIKGVKICRQAKASWIEKFDKRKSPYGKDYYWLTGEFVNDDKGQDTDEYALANGYVSVVPVQFDMTAHHAIQLLNTWDL